MLWRGIATAILSAGLPVCPSVTLRYLDHISWKSSKYNFTLLPTVGDRAFPFAAAHVWNSLPDLVTSASSIAVFQSLLKTYLFDISYVHFPL